MQPIESISRKTSAGRGGCATVVVVPFLGLFVLAGCAMGYFLSIVPLYHVWQARSWTAKQCEVVSSRIDRGDDTARPDIVYRYVAGDREYTSNRYDFLPGKTNDSGVSAIVAAHPPGAVFECYVDPADPAQAVIDRTPTVWFLMGLVFFAVFGVLPGTIGAFALRGRARAAKAALAAGSPTGPSADSRFPSTTWLGSDAAPVVMRPVTSPLKALWVAIALCLLWNGIVGMFTLMEYRMFRDGNSGAWFLGLFLLLFQMVGLFMIGGVFRQFLALGNPRPKLTFSRSSVPLGGSVSIGWELTGAAHRVTRLRMTLKGREEARYRRGTDTHTDTNVFRTETLVDVNQAISIPRGSATLRMPADTMHTFTADNNKVIWTLHVEGEIARWPNMEEDFEITVRPA